MSFRCGFLDFPIQTKIDSQKQYLVRLNFDPGLYTLGERLGVKFYNKQEIEVLNEHMQALPSKQLPHIPFWSLPKKQTFSSEEEAKLAQLQRQEQVRNWIEALQKRSLLKDQVIAVASSPGKAMLLSVRDTFKSPWWIGLYTIFVIAAAYHAFNGVWTFLITWGAILSFRSQKKMIPVCIFAMLVLTFLGLAAIWGSYWVNLKQ